MEKKLATTEIATIQKIIDLTQKGFSSLQVVDKLGLSYTVVTAIKRLYGLASYRKSINILEGQIKKCNIEDDGKGYATFSLAPIITEFDMDVSKEWGFTATQYDNKKRTITIVIKQI